jgi:transcriptional regulator with XRE-family HTH domain
MPTRSDVADHKDTGQFGERIRQRRRAMGLSLRALGEKVELTASFLAQVERGLANPSIASLRQIANVLEVPIFYFFTQERLAERIVRRDARRKLHFPDSNLTYELLVPSLKRQSMGLVIRLGPGEHIDPIRLSEPTEEWLLLLQGQVEICVAGERHVLEPGDSISFEGWEIEGVVSTGDTEAVLVGNMTPPAF